MTELKKHVEALIEKAAKSEDPLDAMQFSQAAVNAANAMSALASVLPKGEVR